MAFVHLHRHSEFSLLDGLGTAYQYSAQAAANGQEALALTDHQTLSGMLHHVEACKGFAKGGKVRVHDPIMPILGVEAYFREDRTIRDDAKALKEYYHMTLWALNLTGWHNIMRLTSDAYKTGFYGKACIDYESLTRWGEGVAVSTGCYGGFVPQNLTLGNYEACEAHMTRLRKACGDHVYLEIMPHNFDGQRQGNIEIINFAARHGAPVFATVDAHAPYQEWGGTHKVMWLISTASSFNEAEKEREKKRKAAEAKGEDVYSSSFDAPDEEFTLWLMDEQQCKDTFALYHPDIPADFIDEAVQNTHDFAASIEPFLVDSSPKLPRVRKGVHLHGVGEVSEDAPDVAETIVRGWCREGWDRIQEIYPPEHWDKWPKEKYVEQLAYELNVFKEKGVFDYFVVIGEAVRWAKDNRIRVGVGRGSAAGSLALYLMRITGVDPITHGLMFERFMNPAREDYPDVDVDFQHNKRGIVKQHMADVWGSDNIADIVSHGTFGLRATIDAVARVFDVPFDEVKALTKQLDDEGGDLTLETLHEISKPLQEFVDKYPEAWKHMLRLERQVKTLSKHAAGVVITADAIDNHMPTMRGNDGSTVTQWSEQADFPIISKFGFLKLDVLATDSLTVQAEALELIEKETGEYIDIDDPRVMPILRDPDCGDPEILARYGRRDTFGCFQFESHGITDMLQGIKPTHFFDLVAANALYRPASLESGTAFDYGKIKNGELPLVYVHPSVEPFMAETYGIMAFQEQTIRIVQALAGYSPAEADLIRKALTKWQSTKVKDNKGRNVLEEQRAEFVRRCKEHSDIDAADANRVYDQILAGTKYSFNKAHSDGYACQSYQDQWLKHHHGKFFWAGLLTWETAKVGKALRIAQGQGIAVLPPDINTSTFGFSIDGDAIRYGFGGVKTVGDAAISALNDLRVKDGEFASFAEFETRVVDAGLARGCNAGKRKALMLAGAFDSLGERADGDTVDLPNPDFDKTLPPSSTNTPVLTYTWDAGLRARMEKEYLGLQLSEGVTKHRDMLAERIYTAEDMESLEDGAQITVGGEITEVKRRQTRRGQPMAFVEIEFGSETFPCVAWADALAQYDALLQEGSIVLVRGEWQREGGTVIREMTTAEQLASYLEAQS